MKFRSFATKFLVGAALAAGMALTGATPAAAAGAPRYVVANSSGVCDTATGEWVISWLLYNGSNENVTVSNVHVTPPVEAFPGSLAPGATNVIQRMVAEPSRTASLNFTVTWADGQSQLVQWAFRPRTLCNKA